MHWSADPGGGFTDPDAPPWLPLGDTAVNVADQRRDPSSILLLTRDLLALRARIADLSTGGYEQWSAPAGVWAWHRGVRHLVVVNLSEDAATLDGIHGRVLISTDRARDGERVDGTLALGPWGGVVVARKTK
jgi:alpha-glucosidase